MEMANINALPAMRSNAGCLVHSELDLFVLYYVQDEMFSGDLLPSAVALWQQPPLSQVTPLVWHPAIWIQLPVDQGLKWLWLTDAVFFQSSD